jgi:hypothetical protein
VHPWRTCRLCRKTSVMPWLMASYNYFCGTRIFMLTCAAQTYLIGATEDDMTNTYAIRANGKYYEASPNFNGQHWQVIGYSADTSTVLHECETREAAMVWIRDHAIR